MAVQACTLATAILWVSSVERLHQFSKSLCRPKSEGIHLQDTLPSVQEESEWAGGPSRHRILFGCCRSLVHLICGASTGAVSFFPPPRIPLVPKSDARSLCGEVEFLGMNHVGAFLFGSAVTYGARWVADSNTSAGKGF